MGNFDGLSEAREIAISNGGICLSTTYKNIRSNLKWKCAQGHRWKAPLVNVKHRGSWCPYCSGLRVYEPLKKAQEIAKRHAGYCLSKSYVNIKTKMLWECEKGHRWQACFDSTSRGHWCPYCAGNRFENGLLFANKIAKERGGKLLSEKYEYMKKMKWRCGNGHIFLKSFSKILSRSEWCPKCKQKEMMEKRLADGNKFAQQIAEKHCGKCLSKYIDIHSKMLWECAQGHRWQASLRQVRKNWCRLCGHLKSAKNSNNSYILYHWKTKEEVICQGSWEMKVAKYFNENHINYEWQSKVFTMPDGRTYRPDCYLYDDDLYIEIKGFFRKDAKEKWEWFRKEHINSELWDKTKLKKMNLL